MAMTTRINSGILTFFLLMLSVPNTSGFIQRQNHGPAFGITSVDRRTMGIQHHNSNRSLSGSSLSEDLATSNVTPFSTTTILAMITTNTEALVEDPLLGSQVLADMAHVALDIAPKMMTSVSKAILPFIAVLGRVFVISADYLPDRSIHPEELIIQMFLLGMAIKDLVRAENFSREA
jgi:hypothetical protein